jgi:beta-galactosidase
MPSVNDNNWRSLDLTPYIITGKENIIAVRLDTKSWDSRWYPGAGIYRNEWLVKTDQIHVSHNGVYCTTPEIKKEQAILSVKAEKGATGSFSLKAESNGL